MTEDLSNTAASLAINGPGNEPAPAPNAAKKLVNSFHDRYFVDTNAEEEGTWVQVADDFWVKVRRGTSAHSKAVRKKLEEPHQALLRAGTLPEAVQEELLTKQMAMSLIMDWTGNGGPRNDDGALLEANPKNIENVLVKYKEFREEILRIIVDRSTYKTQVLDAQVKN